MDLSPLWIHQFHNRIEHVLHLPGNFTGSVLEMTLVLDHCLSAEQLQETLPALLRALKQLGEVFRNVRFHIVDWQSDEQIVTRRCPMLAAMTGQFYQDYVQRVEKKRIELLYQYLKLYHARAKLVLLVTDAQYVMEDEKAGNMALKPFLGRKLIQISVTEKGMELG